jgi:hypothetical protein
MRKYVKHLIDSIPIPNKPTPIDIVLDGGAFAGSLHIGALYYLQKLHKRNIISIQRLSGVSVGSAIALLFKLNSLKMASHIYTIFQDCLRDNLTLDVAFQVIAFMKQLMDKKGVDFYKSLNNNLFISYCDLTTNQHVVISQFDSNFHVCDSVIKSMFIPFLFNGSLSYRNQFIDGFIPHFFHTEPSDKTLGKIHDKPFKKTLFLDLSKFPIQYVCTKYTYDYASTKHKAIDDIHTFFLRHKSTKLCSFVEDWDFLSHLRFKIRSFITFFIIWVFSHLRYFSIQYGIFFQNNKTLLKMQSLLSSVFQIIVRNFLV